jgi:hypothetical protein
MRPHVQFINSNLRFLQCNIRSSIAAHRNECARHGYRAAGLTTFEAPREVAHLFGTDLALSKPKET